LLTERFDEAFRYAHQLHRAQTRKGTPIPYISHLMAVAALVVEHGGTEDRRSRPCCMMPQKIRAAQKDWTKSERNSAAPLPPSSDCTDSWTEPKPEWRPRKEAYLSVLSGKPTQSLLVSLADKTHNAEAILFDHRILGDRLWTRFNGGAGGTRWYYGALAEVFSKVMPGGLADRLSRSVAGFSA
jgi:(p)ppGpp synthase/HD superfamily hydrolase